MSFLRSIVTAPISLLYKIGVSFHNWLYDSGIVEPYVPEIPVISVGNVTVGGTGKTPFTEYLIQLLSQYYEVAVLSRGYKRKTSGFVLADKESTFRTIGDEPMQIKMKFPSVHVAVCEDRRMGIEKLRELYPSLGLIIMDDAFQHRKVLPWLDIVLMDFHRPIYEDHMLPWGNLRDNPCQLRRAEIVIVTKSPNNITPFDASCIREYLNLYAYQKSFFTKIESMDPIPLFPEECITRTDDGSFVPLSKDTNAVVMAAIASPNTFIMYVENNFSLVDTLILPDHHAFMVRDIQKLQQILATAPADTLIFITEKDAVKLCGSSKIPHDIRKRLYYIGIRHSFLFDQESSFQSRVLKYVSKDYKHNFASSK